MRLIGDYHMHSKYSGDSKNEIEAIVKQAISVGLEEIAITDHGPGHSGYGIKRENYKLLRQQIDELRGKYPQIRILLGIEANILGRDGALDMDEEMLAITDWLNAGYHFGAKISEDYMIHLYNFLSRFSGYFYRKAKAINTQTMVRAMHRNQIKAITHPGAKGPIDMDAVAKAAAETHTMLEINNSHGHLSAEEIQIAMKYDVQFILGSDAHELVNIGKVPDALDRVQKARLGLDRIYNIRL
jgi:putative hydrolase